MAFQHWFAQFKWQYDISRGRDSAMYGSCFAAQYQAPNSPPYLWIIWFSFHHLIELNIVTSLSSHLVRISGRLNDCMQEKIINHILIVAWCSNSICQCFVIMKIASIYFTFFLIELWHPAAPRFPVIGPIILTLNWTSEPSLWIASDSDQRR